MTSQVRSRQRVADHGEVLTGEREVNAMLDLVKQETERIESRFLEPACGTGNFLADILRRKLRVVGKRYKKSQLEYERYAVLAVSSIYGIDILEDNVQECRSRLFAIFDEAYTCVCKKDAKDSCRDAVRYILSCNIIHGDALTLKTVGDNNPSAVTFAEWSLVGSQLNRRDFTFRALLSDETATPARSDQNDVAQPALFDANEHRKPRRTRLVSDLGEKVFLPQPERDYPPVHFLEVVRAYGE